MLDLLKRDLKLHWDAMLLPYLILVLAMGAVGLSAHADAAILGTIFIGSLFVPFMPLAIHLREITQGTLGDVVALPRSRAALVGLRYLEVLLFAGSMLVLGHFGSWLAASLTAHRIAPFAFIDGSGLFVISMLLVLGFAYPTPFALRWDGKGLAAAFALLLGGPTLVGFVVPEKRWLDTFMSIVRFLDHLATHPGQTAVAFLALFALSYLLSLKAFQSRDF